MDDQSQRFDGQSHYPLIIIDGRIKYNVLCFRGREALSQPFRWDIEFTVRQRNIAPEQLLMQYAHLWMQSGKVVHGIVTGLKRLSTSANQSHYRVALSSHLALLSHTRQCALYQNQSVIEVVKQVLSHRLKSTGYEFHLKRTYPQRELITQWQETDLQFIQRLLSEVGIWFCSDILDTTKEEIVIFADSQRYYQFNIRLPYREPSGLYDGAQESVWGVRSWHDLVTRRVSTRDYHYRTAGTPQDVTVSVGSDAVTRGEHYRYAVPPYRQTGDDTDPEPETESGAFYARLHHERELNKSARIHLFSNASGLMPGQVLEPQGEVITALKKGVIITLVTFRASRDLRLHVSVWGMPYSEYYSFRPAEIPRPEIHGTIPARIKSPEKHDAFAWLDETGRYGVKLDFDRNGSEQGYHYLWLRQAKPFSGETYGWSTPLTQGTKVAIAYSNGDIDLPYIAHALHDCEHPDPVNRDNHTRNILRTPANSELRMEDKRDKQHIKLATQFGQTQLNIGHLVDAEAQLRGTGLELCTDKMGTIRAGKGLFISADAQDDAQGKMLDMDAALKTIDDLRTKLAGLKAAAEQALALKADIDSQKQMFEQRLKPLNETLHFSAPKGIAFTSGQSKQGIACTRSEGNMQLAASKNVVINADGDISVGVMGNMTALTGEMLRLFAYSGQMSLKSSGGQIDMQAQNGKMHLFAAQKLSITSEDDILFSAKKRITLSGGGSYVKIEAGKIEYGTQQQYLSELKPC